MSVRTWIRDRLNDIRDYYAPWTELAMLRASELRLQLEVKALREASKMHHPEVVWGGLYEKESEFVAKRDSMPDYAKERWAWCIDQYSRMIPKYYRFTDETRYPVFLPMVRYLERIGATIHDIYLNWWRLPNGQYLSVDLDFTPRIQTKSQYNSGIRLSVCGTPNNWNNQVNRKYVKTFYHKSDSDFQRSIATHRDVAKAVEALKQFWEVDRHA